MFSSRARRTALNVQRDDRLRVYVGQDHQRPSRRLRSMNSRKRAARRVDRRHVAQPHDQHLWLACNPPHRSLNISAAPKKNGP